MFERAAKRHKRNTNFQFWTHENHAIHLYSEKFIKEKLMYIHDNPVLSGIVEKPEDYAACKDIFECKKLCKFRFSLGS